MLCSLAVSGEGEVGGSILKVRINVLKISAVFHSGEERRAFLDVNLVRHQRRDRPRL